MPSTDSGSTLDGNCSVNGQAKSQLDKAVQQSKESAAQFVCPDRIDGHTPVKVAVGWKGFRLLCPLDLVSW
eukprot:4131240-Amphidinium_carterae.1